ncbi:DUF4956 domain-containing protein [Methanolacinia paynteri]|uniref:DUF4956 domain-containing protein n=1 Tax=Methanolacinia paynteri TaxID=230356 RepID=UPI00064EF906|nr:DUF4956 domain-containing protein [Methanolacinia paynteri]
MLNLSNTEVLFVLGFLVNFIVAFIIVRLIYYPKKGEKNFIFTFLAFNAVVYFIIGLFTSIELSIGAGFGLFALFSILRYRTETVPIREMTYLFIMVALPILNSILFDSGEYAKLLVIDVLMIVVVWVLENGWGFKREVMQKEVVYEKIDLVKAGHENELIDDLRIRTGLNVRDVDIRSIDFLRDVAQLKIYYTADPVEVMDSFSENIEENPGNPGDKLTEE